MFSGEPHNSNGELQTYHEFSACQPSNVRRKIWPSHFVGSEQFLGMQEKNTSRFFTSLNRCAWLAGLSLHLTHAVNGKSSIQGWILCLPLCVKVKNVGHPIPTLWPSHITRNYSVQERLPFDHQRIGMYKSICAEDKISWFLRQPPFWIPDSTCTDERACVRVRVRVPPMPRRTAQTRTGNPCPTFTANGRSSKCAEFPNSWTRTTRNGAPFESSASLASLNSLSIYEPSPDPIWFP